MDSLLNRVRALLLEPSAGSLYKAAVVVSHHQHRNFKKASWLADTASIKSGHTSHILYPHLAVTAALPTTSLSDLVVLWKFLWTTIRPLDCVMLALAGWAIVPACRWLYLQLAAFRCCYRRHPRDSLNEADAAGEDGGGLMDDCSKRTTTTIPLYNPASFEDSYLFQLVDHIAQVARLSTVVFAADCILKILVGLGCCNQYLQSQTMVENNLSWGLAKILYIAWIAQRLAVLKRYVLGQVIHNSQQAAPNGAARARVASSQRGGQSTPPQQQPLLLRGQASVVDRLLDGIIFICTIMLLLDILDVEMGVGVTSMFAFGSAGTLMVGLASRDLASMLVNGLALSTTNRFVQGEHVKFGDGTIGSVHKIGWMETTIRNYDNLLEVVPNNELGMQRVRNLSRCTVCQIKQTLRFRYEDAEKLPQCLAGIMEEIKLSCKDVITDGSKPFRATWRNFRATHLEVVVDTHHYGKPIGKKYWNDMQDVNLAIFRAVTRHGVRFVTEWSPLDESNGCFKAKK